ncbi:MAG: hypothetical protein Q4F06_08575 [Eubacteriales bacterium]|nr:hypothetical protein [Eubacteriales bacterium]
MAINSLNNYSSNYYNNYSDYNKNDNRIDISVQNDGIARLKESPEVITQSEETKKSESAAAYSVNTAPKHSDPTEFTFDFKKNSDFNLEGATSRYEDMDVTKAISDMQKEDMLNRYKFFVGNRNLGKDEDGTVRLVTGQ